MKRMRIIAVVALIFITSLFPPPAAAGEEIHCMKGIMIVVYCPVPKQDCYFYIDYANCLACYVTIDVS